MTLALADIQRYRLYLARAAAAFAGLCAASVFLYGAFLLLAVEHAAALTDAQGKIQDMSAQVSDLEARYLAAEKALTPERATELGFTAPKEVTTVYASGPARTLSLRGN